MSIGYILWEFPVLSETFILREIEGLLQLEVPLHIYAFRRPSAENVMLRDAHTLMARTTYATVGPMLYAHAYWLKDAPSAYLHGYTVMMQAHRGSIRSLRHSLQMWMRSGAFARHAAFHGVRHFHAHFGNLPASAALGMAALLGTSFSFSIHGYDIHVPDQALLAKARQASFVLACNEHGRNTMLARDPALAERIFLHHHGIPLEFSHPPVHFPDRPPLILTVGRLVAKKGFAVLLAACALLKTQGIVFRAIIIGEGPERRALTAQIQALELQDCVALPGSLCTTEVWSWYPQASVFVLPSQISADGDQDGIPNVLLEALACGCPVIACATGGIPEAVFDGDTGRLIPPRDPVILMQTIQWMLSNPDQARLLGERGRALVQRQFDLKASSQRLSELFRQQIYV